MFSVRRFLSENRRFLWMDRIKWPITQNEYVRIVHRASLAKRIYWRQHNVDCMVLWYGLQTAVADCTTQYTVVDWSRSTLSDSDCRLFVSCQRAATRPAAATSLCVITVCRDGRGGLYGCGVKQQAETKTAGLLAVGLTTAVMLNSSEILTTLIIIPHTTLTVRLRRVYSVTWKYALQNIVSIPRREVEQYWSNCFWNISGRSWRRQYLQVSVHPKSWYKYGTW